MIYQDYVLINGVGVARAIWIINPHTHQLITRTQSANDGAYSVTLPDDTDSVIAVALDDFNDQFKILTRYQVGDRVRPSNYQGQMYEVIIVGTSGSSEPQWHASNTGLIVSGSATFKAVPYYRPVAKFVPF